MAGIHLVQDDIIAQCKLQNEMSVDLFRECGGHEPEKLMRHPLCQHLSRVKGCAPLDMAKHLVLDYSDFAMLAQLAPRAETVLINSQFAISLKRALHRFKETLDFSMRWPVIIFQFDKPIRETEYFSHEPRTYIEGEDRVSAIVLGKYSDHFHAYAWFTSGELQHVQWNKDSFDHTLFFNEVYVVNPTPEANHNKEQLQLLAIAMSAYLNCRNIEVERREPPARLNRSRRRKGQPAFKPYHIALIKKTHPKRSGPGSGGTGSPHGHRYDVEGHFRTYHTKEGPVQYYIDDHERGLDHPAETKPKKIYKVADENLESTGRLRKPGD